jgi:hypothetical protein
MNVNNRSALVTRLILVCAVTIFIFAEILAICSLARPSHERLFGAYVRIPCFLLIGSMPFLFGIDRYRKVRRSARFPDLTESERITLSQEYLAGICSCYTVLVFFIIFAP